MSTKEKILSILNSDSLKNDFISGTISPGEKFLNIYGLYIINFFANLGTKFG